MKKVPIVSIVGLLLLIIVATLALAQETAPKAAEPNQVAQAAADAEQKARDAAFVAQKDRVLQAIGKNEAAQADAECSQLLSRFADHADLAQGVYDIARKYGEVGNADKARQLYGQVMEQWHESEWAIHAQRDIIHAAIKREDAPATQAELDKLLTGFAQHKDIAGTVYNLAKHYRNLQKSDVALKLHQYNVEHYAKDLQGMYSQVEIVKSHLATGDDAAVDAACDKLLATFSQQKTLPKEIYQVGAAYTKVGRSDRARRFYDHVLNQWPESEHAVQCQLAILDEQPQADTGPAVDAAFDKLVELLARQKTPAKEVYLMAVQYNRTHGDQALKLHRHNSRNATKDDKYSLWSQTEVTKAYIRDGDERAAEEATNELLARFAEQPTLSTELARVGDTYAQAGQSDKAEQLYQYIREHWSDAEDTLWAKAGQVRLHITNGEDAAAEAAFQQIATDYASDPGLPEVVVAVGETYYEKGLRLAQEGRVKGQRPPKSVPQAAEVNLRKAMAKWTALTAAPATDPQIAGQALHYTVRAHYRLGEYQSVHELAARLVQQWPNYADAWQVYPLMAKAYKQQMRDGQIAEADGLAALAQLDEQVQEKYPASLAATQARRAIERPRTVAPVRRREQGGEK